MFVNCCRCNWCQRETGSAFAINAVIETDRIEVTGAVDLVKTLSASGLGQEIARCPVCHVAIFSHYAGSGRAAAFVRVGTLDDPAACPPQAHKSTTTKQPWVQLDGSVPVAPEFYEMAEIWPQGSLGRRAAMRAKDGS